ncbi:hypothetical protein BDY19DRAFT_938581 [Irpex rosettiformis]|uniref:Uncharacterized protein n=1 Tax=Irpex rosettiformis TaxID=378272 RepID=A0ACB8U768_9APHY|nr:hypothetical protein BDY19DRAFT_938581 [Irpex rosettiformis]
MGLFSGWFRKTQPPDYEQVLASLALDIQKRQTHLSEIRLRERRATLLFSLYALASWAAYVVIWWLGIIATIGGHSHRDGGVEAVIEGVPVFVGPVVILFIRRIVQMWYTRIGDKEEKHLIGLRKQQREKIEEIKKATNYYTTRTLLERYDDGPRSPAHPPPSADPKTPVKRVPDANGGQHSPRAAGKGQLPVTPNRPTANHQGDTQWATLHPSSAHLTPPLTPGLKQQLSPSPQRPLPPPRKQWYDRLADAILGDEDSASAAGGREAASRYALICQKCFSHNGLVKEMMWDDTQYICRRCGHFNPSPRSMRLAQSQTSPSGASRSSVSPVREDAGTLAPPFEQSIQTQDEPNFELLQTPDGKKGLRKRKGSRKSEAGKDEKEQGSPEAMEVDEDSDS